MTATGIKNLNGIQDKVKIYPNPAQDALQIEYISLENPSYLISIYNNLGQLFSETETRFENNKVEIKTEELPDGIYSVKLSCEKNISYKRFTISR